MTTNYSKPVNLFAAESSALPKEKPSVSKGAKRVLLVIASSGGLLGIVAVGGGAAVSGSLALYPGLGVIGTGVLIEGGVITGVVLYLGINKKTSTEASMNFDEGASLGKKPNVFYHRTVIKYKGVKNQEPINWYIKVEEAKNAKKPHGNAHCFNEYLAYRLDLDILKFNIVPQTYWFNNKEALLKKKLFPNLERHLEGVPKKCPLVVQRGIRKKAKPPSFKEAPSYIKDVSLNTRHAHKVFLYNLIAGRMDNGFFRLDNDAIVDNLVYPIDNDVLGFCMWKDGCSFITQSKIPILDEGVYLVYDWLLLHEVADSPFSDKLVNQILSIDPSKLDELFNELDEEFELDKTFKKNIFNNLKNIQHAFQKAQKENIPLTPKILFGKINYAYDFYLNHEKHQLKDGYHLSTDTFENQKESLEQIYITHRDHQKQEGLLSLDSEEDSFI